MQSLSTVLHRSIRTCTALYKRMIRCREEGSEDPATNGCHANSAADAEANRSFGKEFPTPAILSSASRASRSPVCSKGELSSEILAANAIKPPVAMADPHAGVGVLASPLADPTLRLSYYHSTLRNLEQRPSTSPTSSPGCSSFLQTHSTSSKLK